MRAHAALAAPLALLVQAQPVPEALTAHLKATPLLHADFVQTRRLAALSRPLKSSGNLVVSRELGVLWRMEKPLRLTVALGPKGVAEVDAQGNRKLQTAKDNAMAARMAGIMKSLLEGRWSGLEELFTVKGQGGPEAWTILLEPRPQTAAFIKGVRIRGGAFVETIHVDEPSGDTTDIQFLRFNPGAPLTAEERRLLAFE
ncbi:outer membrane lipoprotein carrier protein LolA [Mesoterricola sediminis]|uniref:Outer-membrane lipoprotein carrier protein n=1 Tax=Mesoterricola sediminis TaxID=2927980 RepID=A0AA48KBC9_9BACT|nr:outer membrane lipoprotein carrier protein LolA [Mesoterricola sediminis]BDU75681.1 outer-membrane lipoprotein carrier protein [Mesoterricola sediminis]